MSTEFAYLPERSGAVEKKKGISYCCFRIFRCLLKVFYPKVTVEGLENLPEKACVIVGNHSHMHGPICGEIYFPGKRRIWCTHQMTKMKEVPAYAFEDFWSRKPKWTHWFYRILSYVIAPLAACISYNASTIPVYYDSRLLITFKQTVSALEEDANIIIFPECYDPYNHIVYRFRDHFISVAKAYYKRTGRALDFVPLYIAPDLKKMYLGKPTSFCPDAPIEEERQRISTYLMEEVTRIAVQLPRHTVVPYPNISPKYYPQNISDEENKT